MFRTSFPAALVFSALILAGCAHDKLLRQETQAFAAAAQKSNAEGREFYERQIRNDRELWATLHQLDRTCTPASVERENSAEDDAGGLCSDAGSLSDLSRTDFARQYAALKFIETYLAALAKAAGDPELDAGKDFAAAAADLNTLLTVFGMQTMAEGRTTAIGDLVGLVEELSKERKSAKDIRAIVVEKRRGVESAFQQIVDALKQDKSHDNATQASMLGILSVAGKASGTGAAGIQSADARRKFIEFHYVRVDGKDRIAECEKGASDKVPVGVLYSEKELCPAPAAGVMQAAQQAHHEFLGLIDGRLSKAQKEKLIKLQRQNLMRAVKLYLGLVTAF